MFSVQFTPEGARSFLRLTKSRPLHALEVAVRLKSLETAGATHEHVFAVIDQRLEITVIFVDRDLVVLALRACMPQSPAIIVAEVTRWSDIERMPNEARKALCIHCAVSAGFTPQVCELVWR